MFSKFAVAIRCTERFTYLNKNKYVLELVLWGNPTLLLPATMRRREKKGRNFPPLSSCEMTAPKIGGEGREVGEVSIVP